MLLSSVERFLRYPCVRPGLFAGELHRYSAQIKNTDNSVMLSNLKGKRLWYTAWATASVLASAFVLVRLSLTEDLQRVDHAVLFFALASSVYVFVSLSARGKVEK